MKDDDRPLVGRQPAEPPFKQVPVGKAEQFVGSDRSVVGRKLEMNNRTHEVIGVLPPYPQYPRRNDVYMPTSACPLMPVGFTMSPAGGSCGAGPPPTPRMT